MQRNGNSFAVMLCSAEWWAGFNVLSEGAANKHAERRHFHSTCCGAAEVTEVGAIASGRLCLGRALQIR